MHTACLPTHAHCRRAYTRGRGRIFLDFLLSWEDLGAAKQDPLQSTILTRRHAREICDGSPHDTKMHACIRICVCVWICICICICVCMCICICMHMRMRMRMPMHMHMIAYDTRKHAQTHAYDTCMRAYHACMHSTRA